MPLPFGIGVGDFIAVGTLAWKLYLACSDSPSVAFRDLGNVCLSIHIAIKKIESNLEANSSELPEQNDSDFGHLAKNCRESLSQLDEIVQKYQSISSKKRAVWDRIKFANEDLDSLRAKLNLHLSAINTFSGGAQLEALTRIENRLNEISLAILRGDKDGSLLSEHATEDEDVWQKLRAELLEDYGITAGDIENHKDAIKAEITKILMDLDVRSTTLFPGDSASCRDLSLTPDLADDEVQGEADAQPILRLPPPPLQTSHEKQIGLPMRKSSTKSLISNDKEPSWISHKLRSPISQHGVVIAREHMHWEIHFVELTAFASYASEFSNHRRIKTSCLHQIVDLRDASQAFSARRRINFTTIPDLRAWTSAVYLHRKMMLFEQRPTPFELDVPLTMDLQQRAMSVRKGDSVDGGAYCVFWDVVLCFGGLQMTRSFPRGFRLLNNIRVLSSGHVGDKRSRTYEWHESEKYNPVQGDDIAPHYRRDSSMVAWNDKLYVFGGYYRDEALSGVWSFDLSKRLWENQPQYGISPNPRWGHQAAVCNDVMYVSGGRESFKGPLIPTLERFDLRTCVWAEVNFGSLQSQISEAVKGNHVLTAFAKKLFIIGTEAIYELDTEPLPLQIDNEQPSSGEIGTSPLA